MNFSFEWFTPVRAGRKDQAENGKLQRGYFAGAVNVDPS
jgi:hypothetical protein